ncbi:MAG: LTA synthase family protein [Lachnospirales bacterium]
MKKYIENKKTVFFEILKYLLFIITSFFLVFLIEFFYYSSNFQTTFDWLFGHIELFLISALAVVSLMIFLYGISCNFLFSLFVPTAVFGIFGYANNLKMFYRDEPILPEEISYIFNLNELLTFLSNKQLFLIVVALIVFVIGSILLFKFTKKKKLTIYNRILCIVLSFYILFSFVNYHSTFKYLNLAYFIFFSLFVCLYISHLNIISKKDDYVNNFFEVFKLLFLVFMALVFIFLGRTNPLKNAITINSVYPAGNFNYTNYNEDSVLTGFITYNFKEIVVEPEIYDLDVIYEKYSNMAKEINETRDSFSELNPNVIIVMSESFSDMSLIENIAFEKNPIEKYNILAEKNTNGSTYAKGIGGSTNTSEYEVLTGFDTQFYNYKNVYLNAGKRERFPSMVSTFENLGYNTSAIHFNDPSFYSRDKGYAAMGFDMFYNDENYKNFEFFGKSPYAKDKSNFDLIYDLIIKTNEPIFIHDVTIQNHGPYFKDFYEEMTNNITGLKAYYNEEASIYATGIEISANELESFTKKVDELDEPTIVLYFGDHLPYFYSADNFQNSPLITKNQVPYMIYSNFGKYTSDEELIGMSFLYSNIFSLGNFKTSPFNAFMENLNKEIKAFGNGGYFTSLEDFTKGTEIYSEEILAYYEEYKAIMYDSVEGDQVLLEKGFFDILE